jgi:hypothetical protein
MIVSKDFKVGFVFFLAVAVLIVFYVSLGAISLGGAKYTYDIEFDRVDGLEPGNDVMVHGAKVGTVSGINLDERTNRVLVRVSVNLKLKFHEGYRIAVIDKSIIAGRAVQITLGDPGKPLHRGLLTGTSQANPFQAVGELVQVIDPHEMRDTFKEMQKLLREMSRGEGVLGRMLRDPELGAGVETAIRNMKDASEMLKSFFGKLDDPEGLLSKIASDREMYASLKTVSDNLVVLTEKMRKPGGLLEVLTDRKFARDFAEISEDLRATAQSARKLIEEARRDPQIFIAGRPGEKESWLIRQLRGGRGPHRPSVSRDTRKITPDD